MYFIPDNSRLRWINNKVDNTKLLEIIKRLLKTDDDLAFLLKLDKDDLETLIACIRGRVDQLGNSH
jgi:hypothetical protein